MQAPQRAAPMVEPMPMSDCSRVADGGRELVAHAPATAPMRKPVARVMLLGAVLAGAMAAVYFSPVKHWLRDPGRVRQALESLGMWSCPVAALAVAILIACGVPRLLFCAIGGMLFGFWWGLLVTQVGTILGYYGIFLFVRWAGRDWVVHHWPKLNKWTSLIHQQGIVGVMLARQMPIHGTLVNLCLGLSQVKQRHFLIGSFIGALPEAIPVTLVGAGLVKGSLAGSAGYMGLAAVAFGVVWIGCRYALRVMRNEQARLALVAEGAEDGAPGEA